MTRQATILLLVLSLGGAATVLGGCASQENQDLKPPPGFVPPAIRPLRINPAGPGRLGFGQGFNSLEVGNKGESWRWMGTRGEVRLANRHARTKLQVAGWLPLEFMKEVPTIQIAVGDHVLSRFAETNRKFVWDYTVDPELLGTEPSVLLVIETSKAARAPGDSRDLGIAVERVTWEAE